MKKHVFAKTYIGLLSFLLFMGFYTEGEAQCSCTDCRCTDSLALVALFDATNGTTWANKTNWKVAGQPIDTWYGIHLNRNGRVNYLNLYLNGLNGNVAPDLYTLKNLDTLSLGDNKGLNPWSLSPLISNLSKLKYFNCWGDSLIGSLPSQIGNLTDL